MNLTLTVSIHQEIMPNQFCKHPHNVWEFGGSGNEGWYDFTGWITKYGKTYYNLGPSLISQLVSNA